MQKLIGYLVILALGFGVSLFATRAHFNTQSLGLLVFLLVFIPTLIKPSIGFIIIIVSMLFSPDVSVGATSARDISVRVEDIFLLVVLLAWLIRTALTKNIAEVFRTKLSKPIFFYMAVCLLSTVLAIIFSEIDIKNSLLSLLKYLEYFLLFFMVRDNLKSLKQSKFFIAVFLLTALAVSVHGNVYVQKSRQAREQYFRVPPPVESRGGGEAGTMSGYLIFMMGIAGGLLVCMRQPAVKIFLGILILLMFRAFLYTLSRGSYLAFLPMVLGVVFFSRKYYLIYVVCVLMVLVGIFMPDIVRQRIKGTVVPKQGVRGTYFQMEESPRDRVESWKSILFERLPKSPFFGHGVAKFFVDGQYFLTLCEIGAFGFVIFIWMLVRLFKMAKESLDVAFAKRDEFSIGLCAGFLSGFIGLLFNGIGTNIFIIIRVVEPFWFIAAIVLMLPKFLEAKEVAV